MLALINILSLQRKIEKIHENIARGDLEGLQHNLTRKKLVMSKDDNGHGLLHKAVYYGQRELVDFLLDKYPETLEVKDWVSGFFTVYVSFVCFDLGFQRYSFNSIMAFSFLHTLNGGLFRNALNGRE